MNGDFAAQARAVLEGAVAARVTPGAVLSAGGPAAPPVAVAVGRSSYGADSPPVTLETRYDIASLTKVVACLPLLLHLVSEGEVTLSDTVGRFHPNAGWSQDPSLGDLTLEQLAGHRSGLPAWTPIHALVNDRRTALANALQSPVTGRRGEYVYSDIGVMVLGAVLEAALSERMDSAFARLVSEPLGMGSTTFGPLPAEVPVAPTEIDPLRGGMLRGVVHDENAWVMGGVSSHAGLFSTAEDLTVYARAWLTLDAPFANPELMATAASDLSNGSGPRTGLLWRLNDRDDWPLGAGVSDAAFGHTGFTGTSIVIDPQGGWTCVLLTNRVHPRRGDAAGTVRTRREVHELVAAAYGG